MKDKIEVEVVPSPCPKTTSGKHMWVKMGGNIPQFASMLICMACGLVDDVDKPKEK